MRNYRRIVGRIVAPVVATLVVVAAMLWLSGTFRRGAVKPGVVQLPAAPPAGPTTRVIEQMHPHEADVVGTLQAQVRTTVTARLVANIVEMRARAGDHVKRDQVLAVLDDSDLRPRVNQANEALRAAGASKRLAKLEVDRLTPMAAQKVATQYELDQWEAKYAEAEADVARAQQAVREAEVALSFAQITSPINGVVIDKQAEAGEQASPGKPLLTIYDPSQLRLEANVREAYIGYLESRKKNQQPIAVVIDALKQTRKGKVEEIVPAADPTSRSFLVKVVLDDSTDLFPGMFGRMRVPLEPQPRLLIPASAVRQVGQLTLVEVLSDERPERRYVRLGQPVGDQVEVLSGLERSEQVIVPSSRAN